jgi:hypothetical protein
VSEFVKSAYRASDLDTVRIIRMIATTAGRNSGRWPSIPDKNQENS